MKTFILLFISISAQGAVRTMTASLPAPVLRIQDQEAYVKLNCKGITTPGGTGDPVVFTSLLNVYFPTSVNAPFPSIFSLRNANQDRFTYILEECNKRRYAQTTFPSGRPAVWPDWGNDRKYQRIEISEALYAVRQINRGAGDACAANYQCQSGSCDTKNTNSCNPSRVNPNISNQVPASL